MKRRAYKHIINEAIVMERRKERNMDIPKRYEFPKWWVFSRA